MQQISLCMIAKDEAACIGACLKSVSGAVEEMIVLDTGSTDETREIARSFGAQVIDYRWEDDFSRARNASMERAQMPYILWLDADDVLDRSEKEKLMALKHRLDGVDAVMMPYHYRCAADGTPELVFERERIVRRGAGFAFEGAVHEAMAVSGRIIHEDIIVRHTRTHSAGRRNLRIYEKQIAQGKVLNARERYYYARELSDNGESEKAQEAFADCLRMEGSAAYRQDAMLQRGHCLRRLGRIRQARQMYLDSLAEGMPCPGALCALGEEAMTRGAYEEAAFWLRAATVAEPEIRNGGFILRDEFTYRPLMLLCVCYDRMGQPRRAAQANEQALLYHPQDEAALSNRRYFAQRLGGGQEEAQAEQRREGGRSAG